jgi:hypothetical protein
MNSSALLRCFIVAERKIAASQESQQIEIVGAGYKIA